MAASNAAPQPTLADRVASLVAAPFASASVILPVVNETTSLEETVRTIRGSVDADVAEFLVVVCKKTTEESREVCARLAEEVGPRFKVFEQTRPFLGGALRDAFEQVQGSHVILMASDLETPPEHVADLIAAAKAQPGVITTGSRWLDGGKFEGYDPLKHVLNYVFQKFFALLYGVRLTDLTYGYRIFPTPLVKAISWEELRRAFLFETLVKPLRLGVKVQEIPVVWRAREEGESQNTFMQNFIYFRPGIRARFTPQAELFAAQKAVPAPTPSPARPAADRPAARQDRPAHVLQPTHRQPQRQNQPNR